MASTLLQYHHELGANTRRMGVVEVFMRDNKRFYERLNFVAANAFTYEFERRANLGSIATRALNGSYTADSGAVVPIREPLTPFGGIVTTDRKFIETKGPGFRASQVAAKVEAASRYFVKQFFDGNSATTPTEWDGLNARLSGHATQEIFAGTNGAVLTLDMTRSLLALVPGDDTQKCLLMNRTQHDALNKLVVAAAGGASTKDVAMRLDNYNGAEIIEVGEDNTLAEILGQDETRGSSNIASSIYCVRFGGDVDEEYLQALIGARGFDAETLPDERNLAVDMIDCLAGLALFHPRCAARLGGVLA